MLIRHQIRTIFSSKIPGSKKLVLLYKATIIKKSSFIMSLALISSYLQIISSSGKSHFLFSCFCQPLFGTFLFLPTLLPYFFDSSDPLSKLYHFLNRKNNNNAFKLKVSVFTYSSFLLMAQRLCLSIV